MHGSTMRRDGLLVLAAWLLGSAGCVQTSVRPVERHVLSAGEAEQRANARAKTAGEPTDPVEILEANLDKDPKNPRWLFELGRVHEVRGELALAEVRYRAGLEATEPGRYTGPALFLGRVLVKEGKFAEAMAHLEAVVAVTPPDPEGYFLNAHYREARFLLGVCSYRLKQLARAKAEFRRYLAIGGSRDQVVTYFPELLADDQTP